MDFKLTDEQVKLRKEFFDVCEGLAKKRPEGFTGLEGCYDTDEGWQYHLQCAKEFASRGWLSLGWPAEYGGQGSMMDKVFLSEATGYHDVPGVDIFGVDMLAPTLLAAASEEIKREYLPSIRSGERMWCELWSEPNAGSDLASLTTRAEKSGDRYVINGQKIWTSNAHHADWMFMLARTDLAQRRSRGLSFFLVDMKSPGITVRPIENMDRSHSFNEVILEEVMVPEENMVGEEHKGWAVTRQTMNFERSGIAMFAEIRKALEHLVQYAKETKRDGIPLAEDPVVRQKLAQLAVDNEAGRALAYRIAWEQSKGGLIMAAYMASAAKVYGSELYQRLTYTGCEIMGMHCQIEENRWAPMQGKFIHDYQMCCGANIAAGSSEVQRNLIAWIGLELPRTI